MVHFHIFCELMAFSDLEQFSGEVWISKFWRGESKGGIVFLGGSSNLGGNYEGQNQDFGAVPTRERYNNIQFPPVVFQPIKDWKWSGSKIEGCR